ncbi:MAG: tRNA (adenosine(37)-N6)-threonylcarbamoyltransferase complex transferase subunit TsaD [Anaerolineae bacterium]|nr:tRNA (adenosine(37)-N6)-threonylcarbamoyltransferase complex transferase subunit TsaD [Anaerolineae bacterium]MBT7072687.1 tRNA (adenosine(37)-N6)-threonylcarbamoyltransferase complex transferase subunit TsaD [Anaerolineae bacterium]MBT7326868.1 tRNA (adenosine(37)-N6)-threonylcarbamoyltransferase complex transferase subunit TsaD [Anaerolineae bacterium]
MRILAIETSCDETAAAVLEDGRALLASTVASQMEMHARFGGVYPEVASRQHVLSITPVIEQTLADAHLTLGDVDAIAVTRGPGLAGSLVVGMNAAKGLVLGSGRPLVGVNHLEGHLYSAWVHDAKDEAPPEPQFPIMALLVSGGHSELNLMTDHLQYQRLGGTLDDAAGEAFDKVARMLGLPYPGGPSIQKAALNGDPTSFKFPRSWLGKSYDFSFSGLKTAVLREVRKLEKEGTLPVANLAAGFQAAVVDVVFTKTIKAAREYGAKEILVAGGVSANTAIREAFMGQDEFPVNIPKLSLCTDNAAMIAAAGHQRFVHGQIDSLDLDVRPTWPLSQI